MAAKAAAATEAKLEVVRKAQQAQFRAVVDYDSFAALLPPLHEASATFQPALFALYNMLCLWQVSAPDLLFTLGGLQAAMPSGVSVEEILRVVLGDATGIFFDRSVTDPMPLVVSQQCIGIIQQQLRTPKWEMDTDAAIELGRKGLEAIKRRRTSEGFVAAAAEDEL